MRKANLDEMTLKSPNDAEDDSLYRADPEEDRIYEYDGEAVDL
jgi:hypothetical protein